MESQSVTYMQELMQSALDVREARTGVETFLAILRRSFVFDNVAVYLQDEQTGALEIAYARAVGRAKHAEADAAWGESFAGQVLAKGAMQVNAPKAEASQEDRLRQPFLLGLPMRSDGLIRGALVFVRFGGPAYEVAHQALATLASGMVSIMFEREIWRKQQAELRELRMQMQLQEDFVSTISHELRTPLGFIKGYSTSLLREDANWDPETQREFLTIIDEETDRLSLLIENVLESARLQSKTLPLRFQPLRLDAVLRDVVTRLKARFKDLDVRLDLEPVPSIHADGVRVAQVFDNLFTNAIKYAPHSSIYVKLQAVGPALRVAVTDQGPGIPQESLPLIFERFYRVRSEKATGTGLGLFICKQIMDAHRGKIWAESTLGKGTTFFIELPINPAT